MVKYYNILNVTYVCHNKNSVITISIISYWSNYNNQYSRFHEALKNGALFKIILSLAVQAAIFSYNFISV